MAIQHDTPYVGRFAPSPTGPLHFGSLLAAVGSFLQARKANGKWLVRIEDLDTPRVVPGATEGILRTLEAFGFAWNDTVEYQSRRTDLYKAAIERLRDAGRVYACTCSRTQIAAANSEASADLESLRYPGTCRLRRVADQESALRFIAPDIDIEVNDTLQGVFRQNVAKTFGDFIVRRRDGIHAYHVAVVIDDAAQNVTEVVRGADLLDSTPRQVLLQQALGLHVPLYCHLPLAVDADHRKLSKSAQSLPIVAERAGELLWYALRALRQSPAPELRAATVRDIWQWAVAHWQLDPLKGLKTCQAP